MRDDESSPRTAVARTVLSAVVVTLLVAALSFSWCVALVRQEARAAAEVAATAVVESIVEPLATPELVAGEPRAVRRLEQAVSGRIRDGSIARVKLWSDDGRVVYSDEPRLVGQRFEAGSGAAGATVSRLSTLLADENLYERVFPRLLEVYVPVGEVEGTRLVFEAYFPAEPLAEHSDALVVPVVVLAAGGLAALLALQVPQTLRLTRRLRREEEVRRGLAARVEAARAEERERLAGRLREGVLQDLAGVGYVLEAVGADLTDPGARELVVRASEVLRGDLTALRGLAHGEVPVRGRHPGLRPGGPSAGPAPAADDERPDQREQGRDHGGGR